MIFFHVNLRYICKKFGVTQEALAFQMKKTQTTIGNWQSGKSQPSIEELLILSNYFSIDLTTFIAVDIEKNSLVKEDSIQSFNAKRKARTVKDNLIKGGVPHSYDYQIPESHVSDEDKTTNWIVLNELRSLSQKIDSVKSSIEKIAGRKDKK